MVVLEEIDKSYRTPRGELHALREIDLRVQDGEFVVVHGPSGSGKTTLLMTIAGMQRPDRGNLLVGGKALYDLSNAERARFRAQNIGFIFQMFHLIPHLNVIENVLFAGSALDASPSGDRAAEMLEDFGMVSHADQFPSQLSAGEKQRVAVARALFNEPALLLADEPTGNLDPENAHVVMQHLRRFREHGGTVIVVSHGAEAHQYADRVVGMTDGCIDNSF